MDLNSTHTVHTHCLKKKNTCFSPNHDLKYSYPKTLRCLWRTKFLSRLSTLIACHKKNFHLTYKINIKQRNDPTGNL